MNQPRAQVPMYTASVITAYAARVQEARVGTNRPNATHGHFLKDYDLPFSALILPECPCSEEQLRGAAQLQRQRQWSSSSVLRTMDALLGSSHSLGWLHLLCTL